MAYLASPEATRFVIDTHKFAFRKKLGQNFLIDGNVVENIVESAGVTAEDTVLEIGPGIGTMTQYLCEAAGHVIAVEIDRMLIPILSDTLEEYNNVEVINDDIMKIDLVDLNDKKNNGRTLKIAANLPYYITTPVIMKILESGVDFSGITIMVQKEVADRMMAGPGNKDYGALSLAVQYYTNPEQEFSVSASCFMPRPNVDSTVICLKKRETPAVIVDDEKFMFRVIRAAFNQRRKTLANALGNAPGINVPKYKIIEAITETGLNEDVRGEKLGLAEFGELSDRLKKCRS